jgi:transposase
MRLKHSKLTTNQTSRLCEHFVAGTPARTAAELDGVNKNSAALFYHRLREIIAAQIEDESPIQGEIEVDECYFGGARKGKRGRGAAGKVAVFGILKRGGRVYTKMILDSLRTTIIPIIKAKVEPDSIVFSDAFASI